VLGWKEYEMEVVRDNADNCIIVCSIENVDRWASTRRFRNGRPCADADRQGISADARRLHRLSAQNRCRYRGSNVQFAVNPADGRMLVIEMNPRVSRSSALASKATGFPIAKIAAKLAVGYTLDELKNDITRTTPASFEPTIDYVVVKIHVSRSRNFPTRRPRSPPA